MLAGVVFLAHFDGDAVSSPQEVFEALQVRHYPCDTPTQQSPALWSNSLQAVWADMIEVVGLLAVCNVLCMVHCKPTLHAQQRKHHVQAARDSPACQAFNGLKDEKAVSQAVRKGTTPLVRSDRETLRRFAHCFQEALSCGWLVLIGSSSSLLLMT